jgi:hypothetical protein
MTSHSHRLIGFVVAIMIMIPNFDCNTIREAGSVPGRVGRKKSGSGWRKKSRSGVGRKESRSGVGRKESGRCTVRL